MESRTPDRQVRDNPELQLYCLEAAVPRQDAMWVFIGTKDCPDRVARRWIWLPWNGWL